jgi:hypothetical protein
MPEDAQSDELASNFSSDEDSEAEEENEDNLLSGLERIVASVKFKKKKHEGPTFAEAMDGPHKAEWEKAINAEYESLRRHGVFSEPCVLPNGYKALDTKIVINTKEPEGS